MAVRLALVVLLTAAFAAATTAGPAGATGRDACAARTVSPSYERKIDSVLAQGTDVLGNMLLHRPGGPTYAAAAKLVPPLLEARTSGGRSLTATGAYYVPSGSPGGPQGESSPMLLVADGSEVLDGSAGGPALQVRVGARHELFGSCLVRSTPARLADGYLPILETAYTDGAHDRYLEESFGGHLPDGVQAAFLRVSTSSGLIRVGALASRTTLTLAWAPRRSTRPFVVSAADYAAARNQVAEGWNAHLAAGASIEVPEPVVMDAERALLIQNLLMSWRYSIGNPYEEFSFPESLDSAQVMSEYGFPDVAHSIVRVSLTRRPTPYANWKRGEKLIAVAAAFRLGDDRDLVSSSTPLLAGYVRSFAAQLGTDDLLARERYSSDIPDSVFGLHSQAIVWQGLHAIAPVWAATGHEGLAREAQVTAARLRTGVLRALARSESRLADGSLFVPVRLLDREPAYPLIPASRGGSYWNLVAPYALASGLLPPATERAALRYLLLHGGRLLGLVRAGAFALYQGTESVSGTDEVYGLNIARFLADLDEPDQIVLSLYGDLAAGMTPHTFVSGEAASVTPIDHAYYRSMYLPPNSVSNAAFLETLRATVVHELPEGSGLELAYATPRGWLAPGKRVAVTNLPTSDGPLSYSLVSQTRRVHATISVPRIGGRTLRLRLRLPGSPKLVSVTVNGAPVHTFAASAETITLTGRGGKLDVEALFAR